MADSETVLSTHPWLRERYNGPDGRLWRQARKLYLFDLTLSSALNLFQFNYKRVEGTLKDNSVILRARSKMTVDAQDEQPYVSGSKWRDDAKSSIRVLIIRIVTLWKPEFLDKHKISCYKLHDTLTPDQLQEFKTHYNDLVEYQETLTVLHYHELWDDLKRNYCEQMSTSRMYRYEFDFQLYEDIPSTEGDDEISLIFATSKFTMHDDYRANSEKIGLFDVLLITVSGKRYFGMVVHTEQNRVDEAQKSHEKYRAKKEDDADLAFEIQETIAICTSTECSEKIKYACSQSNSSSPIINKISNITSQRRMISAINNLDLCPMHIALINPNPTDPFFDLPEEFDDANVRTIEELNSSQSRAVEIAKMMMEGLNEKLHLLHGPPGTGKSKTIARIVFELMKTSEKKTKILLCAPSNNAADELCRRVLDEFEREDNRLKPGNLLRVACKPPSDMRLAEYFLDFLVLDDIYKQLKENPQFWKDIKKQTIESRLFRSAKIFVSTLNYCGSARMKNLVSKLDFLIIDEACQSVEADCLLPLQFKVSKIMLVGDPKQLNPCVTSLAGKKFRLNRSLFSRIYEVLHNSSTRFITLLDTQYRMKSEICEMTNRLFYDKMLKTDKTLIEHPEYQGLKPLFFYNLKNSCHEVNSAKSAFNVDEKQLIKQLCLALTSFLVSRKVANARKADEGNMKNVENHSNDEDYSDSSEDDILEDFVEINFKDLRSVEFQQRIAVITPYNAQINELRRVLPSNIEVLTADSAQGREKDFIILSCVRSTGTMGFLKDANRLNVMLTRAKYGVYIVGDFDFLSKNNETWNNLLENLQNDENLIQSFDARNPPTLLKTIEVLLTS